MKKISVEEFDSMLESDRGMAKRLKDYLGGETDADVVESKTMEFFRNEGYEIDISSMQPLSTGDLENVSGGIDKDSDSYKFAKNLSGVAEKIGNYAGRFSAKVFKHIIKI